MLSVEINSKAPYLATVLSDLRKPEAPHAVCVAKCRFIFCPQTQKWVLGSVPPNFQEIDCWETAATRQVTDLVPEKKQAELLLWGQVAPFAQVLLQDAAGIRTVVKTGYLSPEPVLYWQGEWRMRPQGKSAMDDFMVAPPCMRFSQSWEQISALQFQGIFLSPAIAVDTVFQTNGFEASGILVSGFDHSIISFCCDSICVNTDKGYIDMLWRARFPWDFMKESMGILYLKTR